LLSVDASCTGCHVCVTVCPTAALWAEDDDERFELGFAPLACTGCNLCVELCPPGAMQRTDAAEYVNSVPITLFAGPLNHCTRCHASFIGDGKLCPACAFRRAHPFGSRPRPHSSTQN